VKIEDKARRKPLGAKPRSLGEEQIQLANMRVGGESYALDIMTIKEISRLPEVTRVPQAPDFMEGFVNLRGMVIPLINLRRRLGLGDEPLGPKTRVVTVSVGRQIVGLAVDEIRGVLRLPRSEVLSPPKVLRGDVPEYIGGVVRQDGELILLLDMKQVLSLKEIKGIREMSRDLREKQ